MIACPTVYICDECIGLCNDIIAEEIDREEIVAALEVKLPPLVRAFIAGILERGMPAPVRIRGVLDDRMIEDMARRRAAGEPLDELVFLPRNLATDWSGLHELLARAAPRKSESGDVRPLGAQPWGR
jgi:hypothetical protein